MVAGEAGATGKILINLFALEPGVQVFGFLKTQLEFELSTILGFHVTSEKTKIKLKLKILSFYLYGVKGIFKRRFAGLSSAR